MVLASLAALERTHRRHDEVMAELLEAARRFAAGRPEDGDLARVHDAVDYFERAVTRHFVDEDGSVFPRLSTRRPELAAVLAELSAEHPTQITMQAEVAAAARELDDEARPSAGKTLLDAATKLAEVHHAHVGREDEILADADQALTAQDDREIVSEMETRRGRDDSGRATRATHTLTTKRATKRAPAAKRTASKPRPAAKRTVRKTATPAKRGASKPRATKRPASKRATGRGKR